MNEGQAEEMLEILRDTRALIRLALGERLQDVRDQVFGGEEKQMKAFRLLHEEKSYREIGEAVGVSHTSVGRWIEAWRSANLVHPTEPRCIVTPEALGIS